MDKHGRQYANLSFVNCTGTLLGQLYGAGQRSSKVDLTFSIKLGSPEPASRIIHLASLSATDHRWLCFMLIGHHDRRLCKLAEFHETVSDWFILDRHEHGWTKHEGDCRLIDCDPKWTEGESWWSYLAEQISPHNWFREDMYWTEKVSSVLKIVMAVLALVLIIYVFKSCCVPFAKCICGSGEARRQILHIKLDKSLMSKSIQSV